MVVWLEYLVSRGHERSYTCNHREVRGCIFTLWDWELKVENPNAVFKVQQVVLASSIKNTLQLVYDTESSYGNSQYLFCYICALESHSASYTNENLYFTLYCAPKTKSLHEITRTPGVCVLASWKIQMSAIWRWNCTLNLQRMLHVKLLRLRLSVLLTRFQWCLHTPLLFITAGSFGHCYYLLWGYALPLLAPWPNCGFDTDVVSQE